jgi:hypothetical protein
MGNALSGDDERLRVLLEAWAELPESVKTAVIRPPEILLSITTSAGRRRIGTD